MAEGPVFAPYTLPGERVVVSVIGQRAELQRILEPSPERVDPPCPHFGICGGCALQHWAPAPYLAWKAEQLRLVLARERIETDILPVVAIAPGARRRLALHVRRRADGTVLLGFKSRRSWRLAPIETCLLAAPALVGVLPALRLLAAPFLEHPLSAPTLHVTSTLTGLEVDVTGVERRSGGLSADARVRAAAAATQADLARLTLAGEILYQDREPLVRFGSATVGLPPGAFLQASEQAEEAIARFILQESAGARRFADLFCGVGTFTFRLAAQAPVIAVDLSSPALEALRGAIGGAPGLKSITTEIRDLDRRPVLARELAGVDVAVFDPPRAGAAAQASQLAASNVSRVLGVSCNPASFARDAQILVRGGFTLERLLPVDQFLWSPHIELVGVFHRNGA